MSQKVEIVTLDNPIKRGESSIERIEVRKPDSGSLRGTSLNDLLTMDVNALITVLPRVTHPTLNNHEVRALQPEDLLQLGQVVASFLLPKSARVEMESAPA